MKFEAIIAILLLISSCSSKLTSEKLVKKYRITHKFEDIEESYLRLFKNLKNSPGNYKNNIRISDNNTLRLKFDTEFLCDSLPDNRKYVRFSANVKFGQQAVYIKTFARSILDSESSLKSFFTGINEKRKKYNKFSLKHEKFLEPCSRKLLNQIKRGIVQ